MQGGLITAAISAAIARWRDHIITPLDRRSAIPFEMAKSRIQPDQTQVDIIGIILQAE